MTISPERGFPESRPSHGVAKLLFGLGAALIAACGSSGGDDNTTSSTSTASGSGGSVGSGGTGGAITGDPNLLVGSFQVRLVPLVPASGATPETPATTSVVGKIYDGPTPAQIVWERQASEGACRLSTPRVPFCSTPCGGSSACVEDETCQAYPAAHSAGQVTVSGVHTQAGDSGFTMSAIANGYQPTTSLRYPGFDEGEAITFNAAGDYWSAFTLEAEGISPLVLSNTSIVLDPAQSVKLVWTPPAATGASTVYVKLDISHHGGTKGMIECDAEDTGSLDLPASLVASLLDLGVAGFPTIIVTRKSSGSTTIASGRVDLVVSSTVEQAVQIAGLTSCSSDEECPDGQACQSDLTCS